MSFPVSRPDLSPQGVIASAVHVEKSTPFGERSFLTTRTANGRGVHATKPHALRLGGRARLARAKRLEASSHAICVVGFYFRNGLALVASSCGKKSSDATRPASAVATPTNPACFPSQRGGNRTASGKKRRLRIQHEEIPGYMEAMTMSFDVRHDTNELAGLKAGDRVTFRMLVTESDANAG